MQNVIEQLKQAATYLNTGDLEKSASLAKTILQTVPDSCDAKNILSVIALRQGNYARVIELLKPLIESQPDTPAYHNNIALAYAHRKEFVQAATHFRQAIRLNPDYVPAHIDLCSVAREIGQLDEAVEEGRIAIRLAPNDVNAHSNLALAYELFGLHKQAREHYTRAATLAPDNARIQYMGGVGFLGTGDKAAAKHCFEQAVRLEPNYAAPYRMLARLQTYESPEHMDFARLISMLEDEALSDEDRCHLHFALGKMYEDCGHYPQAFEHFHEGNAIENKNQDFKPETFRDHVSSLIDTYTNNLISDKARMGSPSNVPVFIIGMPRSGTTLVEQILSSHPSVYGAGELPWFTKVEYSLSEVLGSSEPYPECVKNLGAEAMQMFPSKYLDYLAILSEHGNYSHITDKMPDNFERAGLISILFPKAKIIHCRRDPLDNCISQFGLYFPGKVGYSYDLYNLGAYHAQYQRLMRHWRTVLPETIMLDINYEELVADQEGESHRLLEFVGLPWNDNCLKFFESKRTVRTASEFQVRKPIYTSSIGRWKHYDAFLEPLRDGLQEFKNS